jgi:CheY-like chemotaxis protein
LSRNQDFHVLIIEDSDSKFTAISKLVREVLPHAVLQRAATQVEAEGLLEREVWDLVCLDISLDIAPSSLGQRNRGQATIGGLNLAERMFLLEQEFPTIIVTAFDSFSTAEFGNQSNTEIMGFDQVVKLAHDFLPNHLIACLQYNSPAWKDDMLAGIKKAMLQ